MLFFLLTKLSTVHPQATNDEIEEAIDNGQVDKMFAQTTLDGAYMQGQAKNAMAYVQDRHRDIKAIEASVRVSLFLLLFQYSFSPFFSSSIFFHFLPSFLPSLSRLCLLYFLPFCYHNLIFCRNLTNSSWI